MALSNRQQAFKRFKQKLRLLIAEDQLKEVCGMLIDQLIEECQAKEKAYGFHGRITNLEEDELDGTIDDQNARLERARIRKALLALVNSLEESEYVFEEQKTEDSEDRVTLDEYHCYTCDRIDQQDTFQRFYKRVKNKPQFYYLYGLDLQAHEGMIKRLAFYLEGNSLTFLDAKTAVTREVLHEVLPVPRSKDLSNYKTNMLRTLFKFLGLDPDQHGPLLEKNLAYLWKTSPRISKYTPKDKVCLSFTITHRQWDKEMIPDAVRWFVEDFCLNELPEQAPKFVFFFSIKYANRVKEKIQKEVEEVVKEVEAAIDQARYLRALPELDMVCIDDIEEWFEQYSNIEPRAYKREELLDKYFGEAEEHYMEYVQDKLLEIIQLYNDGELQ